MEALCRWTSSVFLLLALNIGCIQSQNVGANCPLPAQTLQAETLRDSNLGLINPLLQMDSMFLYPNGLAPRETLECQRQAMQDRNTPLSLRQQQANVPTSQNPCVNLALLNGQYPQSGSLPGSNLPGTLLQQNQCPIAPFVTPYLPQQNAVLETLQTPQGPFLPQGILPGTLPTLSGPFTPFTSAPNLGIDIWPSPQQGSLCPRTDSSPNIVPNLGNHFTTLVPIKPGFSAPCTEVLPFQAAVLPTTQGISPISPPITQFTPLNNQGVPIDGVNCLPRALGPQCDVPLETPPCLASIPQCSPPVGPSLQNVIPFPQLNMFRLPRPTLFQSPFQGPLPNTLPVQCDVNTHCPPTNIVDHAPICVNTAQIQQEPICPVPLAPAYFEPNILPGLSSNLPLSPLKSSAVFQPPPILNPSTFTTEEAPVFMPPPLSQSCPPNGFAGFLPQAANSANCPLTPNAFNSCFNGGLPPVLPNAFIGPNMDNSRFCQPGITEASPTPINLQINVPPPVIPAPRITIINATPAPEAPVSTAATDSSIFDSPYSMPPIIIEGGRSRSRSWLPLFLVALFARDGDFGGYGGGCDSDPIPIPYPIAIPTNNPVIVQK